MVCLVLTEPYGYEGLVARVASEAPGEVWLVVYFLRPSRLQTTVKELGDQGWLGPGPLRPLLDSLMAGYRALAGEILREVAHSAQNTNAAVHTMVVEGDLDDLARTLHGKCSRLYCDDAELMDQLRSGGMNVD